MSPTKSPADATGTAGSAGSRADRPESEQRRGFAADWRVRENCGKSAGELREDSSFLGVPADLQPLPPAVPAPSLVPVPSLKMPREVNPADALKLRGDAWHGAAVGRSLTKGGRGSSDAAATGRHMS
jgi:hypothetical protein